LNLRPSGYEPDELPDCSTPRREDEDSSDSSQDQFRTVTNALNAASRRSYAVAVGEVRLVDVVVVDDDPAWAAANRLAACFTAA
jgi:hypothetical protein